MDDLWRRIISVTNYKQTEQEFMAKSPHVRVHIKGNKLVMLNGYKKFLFNNTLFNEY